MTTISSTTSLSSPALVMEDGADAITQVIVHPLVLLHVLDHHTRRQEASGRVIGTLLGRRDGKKVRYDNWFWLTKILSFRCLNVYSSMKFHHRCILSSYKPCTFPDHCYTIVDRSHKLFCSAPCRKRRRSCHWKRFQQTNVGLASTSQ